MKRFLLILIVIIVFSLSACSNTSENEQIPDSDLLAIKKEQEEVEKSATDNNAINTENDHTDMLPGVEHADTVEEELQYCGPMPGSFDSVQEMHAALRLGWTIDEKNEMYSDFSVNNLLDVPYYYVPADIDGFFLNGITANHAGYTYYYYSNDTSNPEITPAKAQIWVAVHWDPVIGENDALTSIEQNTYYNYKRDENGYIYDRLRKHIYSQIDRHRIRVLLITFDPEMEAQYNTYEVMTSICESVRKVTINPNHVTE